MIGRILAHYEITAHLGTGGMGEVYRATDTKLGREVAIKVLPEAVSTDAERLARFQREARTLASLHHPNVASIFGFEEADGVRFLVMELVEGEDLSQRLQRGPLPLDETIAVARQVARGLEAAHEKGIVHRDLKPANIKSAADGQAKILDFGLARAYADEPDAQDLEHSPTITQAMTQAGVILGTAAYMSPEQAKGKTVGKQTDVFSFGCVLYECLTGRQVFPGESVTDVLASVLRAEPDWKALPASTPANVRSVLRRCLEKDPRNRLRDVGDVELLLRDTEEEQLAATVARPNRLWPILAGGLAVALVASWLLRDHAVAPSDAPRVTAMVQLTDLPGLQREISLSPDGRQLLYAARDGGDADIFLLRVGGENPINLTSNSPEHDFEPAFSPDGQRIAFASDREGGGIFVMGATGETPRRVADEGFGPAWSPDGTKLVYTTEHVVDPYARQSLANLWVVDLASGDKKHLSDIDAVDPSWSPHGHRIAFWTHLQTIQGQRDLWTIDPDGGEPTAVMIDAATDWDPSWSPDGRWLYFVSDRGGSPDVWRIGIDERTGQAQGEPQPVTTGMTRIAEVDVSASGRMGVVSERRAGRILSVGFDPESERTVGDLVTLHSSAYEFWQIELSRDKRWIAFGTAAPTERIYVMRTDGSERRKLVDDEYRNRGPSFSPDGRWITFYTNRTGSYDIWAVRTDGTGLKAITANTGDVNEPQWDAEGRVSTTVQSPAVLSAWIQLPPGGLDALTGPVGIEPIAGASDFSLLAWSPSGRWALGGIMPTWHLALFSRDAANIEVIERDGREIDFGTSAAWIDDERLLFWDNDRDGAFVFDRETREFRPVPGLPGASHFAVGDGELVIGQRLHESDVWLLTLDEAP